MVSAAVSIDTGTSLATARMPTSSKLMPSTPGAAATSEEWACAWSYGRVLQVRCKGFRAQGLPAGPQVEVEQDSDQDGVGEGDRHGERRRYRLDQPAHAAHQRCENRAHQSREEAGDQKHRERVPPVAADQRPGAR